MVVKDLGTHGRSIFKVFKETAKGFEWVFDAAKNGAQIAAKHKGPVGLSNISIKSQSSGIQFLGFFAC
jgi:hypothetical protein